MKTKKPDKIFITDVKCEAEWKSFAKGINSTTYLMIGQFKVASYYYVAKNLRPRENPEEKNYHITNEIKHLSLEYASTVSEAQEKCIEIAKEFVKQLQS